MLRKLILKHREIPIPVPVHTLGEAIHWLENTFLLKNDAVLTSAILEDKELINELYRKSVRDLRLNESSNLQIKIETPKDLSSQSLDVVCDLAYGIAIRLKKMDLESWQEQGAKAVGDLEEIHSDVQLLLDLLAHINGLSDEIPMHMSTINRLCSLLVLENLQLRTSLTGENWMAVAKVLEKQMLPHLRELAREGEAIQLQMLSHSV